MNIKEVIKQLESLVEEFGDDVEVKIQSSIFDPPKVILTVGYDEEENEAIIG